MIGEQNLQIADSRLFRVIATRVAIQSGASFACHANQVTGLMQQRVHRRVTANEHGRPNQPGL